MSSTGGSCCGNQNCKCTPGSCNCGQNCSCGTKECCEGGNKFQSYEYSKTSHYSNIGGRQQCEGEQIKRHRINDNMEEQIIRQKQLPGGKTLVTKQIREGDQVKKVDQYVKGSSNQPSIQ